MLYASLIMWQRMQRSPVAKAFSIGKSSGFLPAPRRRRSFSSARPRAASALPALRAAALPGYAPRPSRVPAAASRNPAVRVDEEAHPGQVVVVTEDVEVHAVHANDAEETNLSAIARISCHDAPPVRQTEQSLQTSQRRRQRSACRLACLLAGEGEVVDEVDPVALRRRRRGGRCQHQPEQPERKVAVRHAKAPWKRAKQFSIEPTRSGCEFKRCQAGRLPRRWHSPGTVIESPASPCAAVAPI